MPFDQSTFTINQELCIGCKQCETDCDSLAISYDEANKKCIINQKRCKSCSHCACICPMNAVEDGTGAFLDWKDPTIDPEALHMFLAGKRSVRQFSDRPVSKEILEKILEVGSFTSTASNTQDWYATIVTSPEKRAILVKGVKKMEGLISKVLKNPAGRAIAKLVPAGKTYLANPNIMEKISAMEEGMQGDHDHVLFHAPVVVILSTDKNSPMGAANCHLAGAAMMYDLQARGIGSFYVGMVEQMLMRSSATREQIGIPHGHKVHMVFALGYSKVKYRRLPHRIKMPVQFV